MTNKSIEPSFDFKSALIIFAIIFAVILVGVESINYSLNYLSDQGLITDERENMIRMISGLFGQ